MFNFFRSKKTDLEIIQLLEQTIGNELSRLDKIDLNSRGYRLNAQNQITALNLTHYNLKKLPTAIGQLHNLTALYLSWNKLGTLPAWIGRLHNLTELSLGWNGLSALPAWIGQLHNLTDLSLYGNELSTLPAKIGQLHNLTALFLGSNELSNLPAVIGQLHNLTQLDLGSNQLSTVPAVIGQLHNLTELHLEYNQLSTLPLEIGQLQNLIYLRLNGNQLSTLPAVIGQLHNLTYLNLNNNQLSSLSADIGKLHNLTQLDLRENQLSTLPAVIGQLHNLTQLDLRENQLSTVPAVIGQLRKLYKLDLSVNKLSTLPAEIGQLQNLTSLGLAGNQLSTLPAWIGQLQNLTSLGLAGNQLSTLPAWIGQLQKLQGISLYNNKFTQFPKTLLELNLKVKWESYLLEGISVENNPFEIPPVEIVKQGRQAIVDYYAALERQPEHAVTEVEMPVKEQAQSPIKKQQSRQLNEAKLILIGDGAAGKTSLMKRLLGQTFDPQESQTHGININTLLLPDPDNQIKLHCWDFGGQQIMHATHQFFLSKRCLYLLVIDSRRETQVEYWLQHIQAFGDNAPVIIVINKIDENPHFNLPQQRQLKQRYPNLKHIHRISCRTDRGLDELNTTIKNTLPAIDLLNTLVPATWFNVKTAITDQAQHSNFASYDQYVELCQRHGINSASEQTTLINFLHDLGIINHFPDRWLRETNVINPQWLTEAVYTIINAPHLAGYGKLRSADLTTLLDATIYPERKHDYILELMQKFALCYSLDADTYLLPDLFPVTEPDFTFDASHALHFIVEYAFLPKAVFTRFVVKLHREIVTDTYWRSGVLLHDANSNTTALVETTPNRITFQISGPQQQEYLVILRFMLQDINRSFNQLRVTEKIGLPDSPNLSVDYAYLLTLVKNGQSLYIPPENPTTAYKISDLLGVITQPTESELLTRINEIIQRLEAQGFTEEKDLRDHIDEVVKFNPSVFGLSVDVNALLKKVWARHKA